jgi:hypothetical protein
MLSRGHSMPVSSSMDVYSTAPITTSCGPSAFADGELAEAARTKTPPIALWCAKEAAAKALGVGLLGEPRRWRVHDLTLDARAATVSIEALRVPISLHFQDRVVIAVALTPRQVAAEARETLRVAGPSEAKISA